MRGLQSNQQMNLIFDAADFQRFAAELVHDPSGIDGGYCFHFPVVSLRLPPANV